VAKSSTIHITARVSPLHCQPLSGGLNSTTILSKETDFDDASKGGHQRHWREFSVSSENWSDYGRTLGKRINRDITSHASVRGDHGVVPVPVWRGKRIDEIHPGAVPATLVHQSQTNLARRAGHIPVQTSREHARLRGVWWLTRRPRTHFLKTNREYTLPDEHSTDILVFELPPSSTVRNRGNRMAESPSNDGGKRDDAALTAQRPTASVFLSRQDPTGSACSTIDCIVGLQFIR
jgi:hypothetical protein